MTHARTVALVLLALLLAPACQERARNGKEGAPRNGAAPGRTRYPLVGRVVEVDRAQRTVTLAHHDIPGFMPAMTMPFVVREEDAASLDGVGPGDEVHASLVAQDSRYWLEGLSVVRKATPGAPTTSAERAPAPPMAEPGATLPAVSLVDQGGRAFRLADLRGKAVALTFVYTRCPLPDYCPRMMSHFQRAESLLLADPKLRERTHLVTVSFDPEHDTPAVLRRFGAAFQVSRPPFAHWTLATGDERALRALGGALELEYQAESRSFTHNLRTAVLGTDGRLRRLFRGNDWTPEELVAELRAAAL